MSLIEGRDKVTDRRVVIYPAYINSNVTVAGGRRIPKEKGCKDPNVIEITDCCVGILKLKAEYERKSYSRQWWVLGRVRVQLKNEDGTLCNPAIPDRKTLLLKVAELVPHHPSRSKQALAAKAAEEKRQREAREKAERGAASASAPSGAAAKGGSKKKKGRK